MNRRQMLQGSAASLILPKVSSVQASRGRTALPTLPVLEQPDVVFAFVGDTDGERLALTRSGAVWAVSHGGADIRVEFQPRSHEAAISIFAARVPAQRFHMRWKIRIPEGALALGDAWERSYGDLAWSPLRAERPMPWYALLHTNGHTVGMGVKTGADSFAFWQVDESGISLWLDVRNGGNGVMLGDRTLKAATIVTHEGAAGESSFSVARQLCSAMAQGTVIANRRGPASLDTLYGSNDWYYAYGRNTHDGILRDADLVAASAPASGPRPFTVIDDGYQDPVRFPSMPRLAGQIRSRNVLPGIWIRPLRASATTPKNLLLPQARWHGSGDGQAPPAFDPTIPEALASVIAVAREACDWGFDLIKHDFTTFELFGLWGSQMGASPTQGDWHFNNRSQTNAEIVKTLYRALRGTCGENRVILGCNTIGHLSVGIFDASRTGDDVSGHDWERTRRTGVNTLALRLPQHRIFHRVDADCVPFTLEVPWSMTRQWLQVVAESGTVLLISPDPRAVGDDQKRAIREAFELSVLGTGNEPADWLESRTPQLWRTGSTSHEFDWLLPEGASPFPIGIQRGPN